MALFRLLGRMEPGSRASVPGLEGVHPGSFLLPSAAGGILAEHYLPVLCADLASWRRRYAPEAAAAVLPLLHAAPRKDAVRMLLLVREVYGLGAFLPLPTAWAADLLPLDTLLAPALPEDALELALTLSSDGFEGTVMELITLSTTATGFPSPL